MPLTLTQKKAVVAEVAEVAKSAASVVAAEYRGLDVAEMTELRKQARAAGVYLRVVPNSLAKRAVESTGFECLREGLRGPLVLAFAREDPGSAARVVRDYRRTHQKLEIRLAAFGGKLIDPADIDTLANIPTRDEAIARLMTVLMAPVTKLARTLAEPHARLVRAMGAVRDRKKAAAGGQQEAVVGEDTG